MGSARSARERERVTVHSVDPRKVDDGIVYFTCPSCGADIREGFPAHGGPIPYTHDRSSGVDCRLVIDIDPTGTDHEIVEIRGGVSQEDVIRRRQDDVGRIEKAVRAGVAAMSQRAAEGER